MRFALFAAVLLSSSFAFADIPPLPPPNQANQGGPPPPGECAVSAQQRPGEQCQECAASYEAPDKCQNELGSRGFAKRCRGPGASVWHEVWCSGGGAPPPAEKKGCAACAVGSDSDSAWLALFSASVLLAGACLRRISSSSRDRTDR
jgi:hypothetical protein